MRYGSRGDVSVLSLYYQIYGKNNDLGLEYEPGYLHFFNQGKPRTFEVPDNIVTYLDPIYKAEKAEEKLKSAKEAYYSGRNINNISQVEKFNRRMNAHVLKAVGNNNNEEKDYEPGE